MTAHDKVSETIRKLLRLSKSPVPGESEAAMAKAFELARKHQVNLESLDLDADVRRIVHRAMHVGRRLPHDRHLAIGIVNTFFNVSPILRYPDVLLVGDSSSVAVAEYVIDYLVRSVRSDACRMRKAQGPRFTNRRRRSYVSGWFYGVARTLKQTDASLVTQGAGLVLVRGAQRREHYIAHEIGRVLTKRVQGQDRPDSAYLSCGFAHGKAVQIRPGMTAAPAAIQIGGRQP